MTMSEIVPVGTGRVALPNIALPKPPPTRIYISGHEYKIQAPRIPLPPIANVVKVILNYTLAASRTANNILHIKTGGGFVPSDITQMVQLANKLFTLLTTGGSAIPNLFTSSTKLNSVVVKDMGGTSTQAISTASPVAGVATGTGHPPQVAVTVSWQVAGTWRGGKPRTYSPCPPINASVPAGSSTLDPAFAGSVEATWSAFFTAVAGITTAPTGTFQLGMVSYFTGHALRPSPIFMEFTNAKVHERLDSQRRRSGPESAFPVIP
jgi:hypothetical protein